eukprot:CAMPEP_0116016618 /NCGR_PEP_ID=MMETSP0321-20121206/7583_1 /TAXON_ID=163516 /ORGANISM="Leptocylindrus danicus var. danicus, Strain B650" /LENGTH=743 /DNA_ID=CAMNT_0003486701 /DNA_START=176 /DNA_END=2407 /DNA_ORIENTATION=-
MFKKIFGKNKKDKDSDPAPPQAAAAPQDAAPVARKKDRQKVAAQKLVVASNYVPPKYPKDTFTVKFIVEVLAESFVFASVDTKGRKTFIDAMQEETARAGDEIIKQGDIGDYFYILEQGDVSFLVDGKEVGTAGRRAVFGELALLYDTPRAATVNALTDCKLWKIDQKTFRYIMVASTQGEDQKTYATLRKVTLFESLPPDFFVKLSSAMTTKSCQPGEEIIKKGEIGDVFYVIRDGKVKLTDIGLDPSVKFDDHELAAGEFFGERALLTGDRRAANITAVDDCTLLCLSRADFEEIIGPLTDLLKLAEVRQMLRGLPPFADKSLEPLQVEKLSGAVKKTFYRKGANIINAGKKGFYFIFDGKVLVSGADGDEELSAGYFGDMNTSGITVKILEDTTCGFLPTSSITRIVDLTSEGKEAPKKKMLQISLGDLKLHKMLGEGSFGKVFLVTLRSGSDKTPYALKMMNKKQLIQSRQVNNVKGEKGIMMSFDHPFIINLLATFQDECSIYMVLSLAQGGELYSLMQKSPGYKLSHSSVQFYTACALEGLAHLHSRNVCHRDVKPENILIGNDGYCILIDMGFAKVIEDKSFTLCGTPVYLAPEILVMKGHNKGVDYWALGVLIFESLIGHEPFYADDQTAMFKKICRFQYSIPNSIRSDARDIISKLLVGQKKRIGCLANGDRDIRDHPFYSSINWDDLVSKKISVPWDPKIKSGLDASNFDNMKYKPEKKVYLSAEENKLFEGF